MPLPRGTIVIVSNAYGEKIVYLRQSASDNPADYSMGLRVSDTPTGRIYVTEGRVRRPS